MDTKGTSKAIKSKLSAEEKYYETTWDFPDPSDLPIDYRSIHDYMTPQSITQLPSTHNTQYLYEKYSTDDLFCNVRNSKFGIPVPIQRPDYAL